MLCSAILRVPRHVWLHAKLRNDDGESDLPNRAARRDLRNPVAKPCCEYFQNNTAWHSSHCLNMLPAQHANAFEHINKCIAHVALHTTCVLTCAQQQSLVLIFARTLWGIMRQAPVNCTPPATLNTIAIGKYCLRVTNHGMTYTQTTTSR